MAFTAQLTNIPPKLLVKRRQTADLLSISYEKVKELERRGLLDKVRLTPGGDVHHRYKQVVELAEAGTEEPSDA